MGATLRVTTGGKTFTHDLERFGANGRNMRPALAKIAQVQVDAVRDQFRTQGHHYGARWASLSPRYKVRKMRVKPGRPILVYSGKLKSMAAPVRAENGGVYKVTARRAEVGVTDTQVPYAKYHQDGGKTMPARPFLAAPTRKDQKAMVSVIHDHLAHGVRGVS